MSRVTPSRAARTARVEGGSGPGGRGGEQGRTRVGRPAKDSQGIGRQGFVALGGLPASLSARQSIAFGSAGEEHAGAGGALAPPLRAASGPPKQDRAGNGSAHPLRSKSSLYCMPQRMNTKSQPRTGHHGPRRHGRADRKGISMRTAVVRRRTRLRRRVNGRTARRTVHRRVLLCA